MAETVYSKKTKTCSIDRSTVWGRSIDDRQTSAVWLVYVYKGKFYKNALYVLCTKKYRFRGIN